MASINPKLEFYRFKLNPRQNGRISKYNDDGTPNFDELETLCENYFNDEVLPELRPDLNVTKAK